MMEYASTRTVALYVNATNRTIQKGGITKTINDQYWNDDIVPILYPIWDSDKDKLETFVYYKDETASIYKNKYQRNQKTGEYKWVSYELDLQFFSKDEINSLYTSLEQKFLEYRDIEDYDLDRALRSTFARDNYVNWNKIIIIRNFLLQDSDWTQLDDNSLTDEQKQLWKKYRQYLRDLTKDQKGIPAAEVVFPINPSKYENLEESGEYLTNEYQHFYRLNQIVYKKYVPRILAYLSISMTINNIDEMPVSKVYPVYDNANVLDDILRTVADNIENGGL